MSVARRLGRTLGGKWTWDNRASWHCDDGKRIVSRVSAGVDEFDNDVGPAQLWLYGDGEPRRAEQYACRLIEAWWPEPAPAAPEREEPRCGPDCKDGRHEFGCAKWVPPPACTCKMPIGFGRSFRGFMAPDPKCPRCHPAPSPASTPEPEKGGRS